MAKVELELSEGEWVELISAVSSKAYLVRERHYGDFDPMSGFDPDKWAATLDAIKQTLEQAWTGEESDRLQRDVGTTQEDGKGSKEGRRGGNRSDNGAPSTGRT